MLAGRTLNNRYDVLDLIASGGMGEVYRARDRELDELVALKVIRTDRSDAEMVERFRHEVKLARRVTHANVARTFELGHSDDLVFCTMELVEGDTLAERLAHETRLSIAEAVHIACAVCDGLTAAHAANVIHRDIKPANILLANDGRVVLADFGIAAARVSGTREPSGTPAYMAPEQARGEPATPATDVYSVGVVLYEMLTGQRAFHGTVVQIIEMKQEIDRLVPTGGEVSQGLSDVVAQATATRLADRIATAGALRRALSPWARADMQVLHAPRRPPIYTLQDRTVIVVAPRVDGDNPRIHIASEIHEELLATLGRSTLRILPRTEATLAPARLVVRFEVRDELVMSVTARGEPPFRLGLPLEADQIARTVTLAANATFATIDAKPGPIDQRSSEAYELLLRARQLARTGSVSTTHALALVEQATELAPSDPKIQAVHAILLSRLAFFSAENQASILRRAGEFLRAALEGAHDLADAHLAAGHYELHTGDPTIAAGHYRIAIARAPYLAEAHEHLGRVLIEAGYVDAALSRFEEANAIAPHFASVQWEVARANALEGRWDAHDRILADVDMTLRPVAYGRSAWWRGDMTLLRKARGEIGASFFDTNLVARLFDVFLENTWSSDREELIARALDTQAASRRRKTFISQLVAEAAGFAGEVDTCLRILRHATEQGLFDLHWLDHVPQLAEVRKSPALVPIRARVEARARGIYDALYGDHIVATSDTVLATS